MLAGHLQTKNGKIYAVLNCKHRDGRRFPKWVSTNLPDKKGNKRAAKEMLNHFCSIYNEYGELIAEEKTDTIQEDVCIPKEDQSKAEEDVILPPSADAISGDMLFADYMLSWLSYKETEVDPITFAGYCESVENHIYPYFKETGVTLAQLDSLQLKEFYKKERIGDPEHGKRAKKGTTVVRYHANIHAALESAMADGLIGNNAAHKQRPATEKYIGSFYMPDEALECMHLAEGSKLELAVYFGLFYGLRRSEIVGLKWQNFDFERNTFTIAHTVTSFRKRGKGKIQSYAKDKTKNKSSMRTLPLIPLFREKLLALKEKQKYERSLFKKSYVQDYIGYVYVNELGELIKPNYISSEFPKFLRKHGMRKIRFHDTRHSCASLLLRNGVSMKEIQAWLGHSDYSTTANLYAHLDMEDAMLTSAARLSNGLFGSTADTPPDQPPTSPAQEVNDAQDSKGSHLRLVAI